VKCSNKTQSVECATESEIDQKIRKYTVMTVSLINFIEYEDVVPGVGPIKRIAKTFSLDSL
jgi:hypothetical protein